MQGVDAMKFPKLNLLTMSLGRRLALALAVLALLWLAIFWALGGFNAALGGVR